MYKSPLIYHEMIEISNLKPKKSNNNYCLKYFVRYDQLRVH